MEEGQTATFTVTVTGTSTSEVVVSYEVDTTASTATSGDDYTALPSQAELTIGAGVASGTIEVATKTDAVLEPDETVVLKLTAASTAGEVSVSTATAQATIEDTGAVKVSVEDAAAIEGESVQFVVELSGAVSSEVVVSYATSDGTGAHPAAAGTDYTAVSATTLTFRPGEALRQTVTVATTEDTLNEADEAFTVALSGVTLPDGVSLNADKDEAEGTIEDDDGLTVSVAGPGTKVEEGQTATFTVTVTGTSTSEVVVSYEVDTAASTATSGDDYTAPPGQAALTIGAGEASGTIEVATKTDAVLEPDETVVLELTAASTAGEVSVSTATAQATIEDTGAVKVSVEDAAAIEGESVQFVVELSGAVSSEVVVSYATSDGTGAHPAAAGTDYTAVSATTLTFRPGEALRQTVTVATTEDTLNEADEAFTVALSGVTLPDGVSLNADKDEATGTIEDDDALTVSVAGPGTKVEEGQTATFTVTVTGTSTSEVVVSYEVDTAASTATSGDDYTAPPSQAELTIGAGVASGTIEVATKTDAVLEPDETVVLELTAASTAGEVSVSTATAQATIEDTGAVKVSVEDAAAIEGESVQFVVELSGAVSSEVVVSYATSDGTGAHPAAAGTDYTAVSATTLTFRPGEALRQTVTVATTEDTLNEADEAFTVALSGVTLPDGVSLNADKDEATGTIEDDDGLTVSVAGPGTKVEEGQTATFTVTVTGTSTSEVVVSYEVDTAASTATSGDDYTAPPGQAALTIGAGEASGTIEVATKTDAVLEPDETVVLKLTAASTAGEVSVSTATATATIEDTGAVTVSVEDAAAIEGESVQFEVELSGAVSSEVVVSYATSDGTGAHPAAAGTDYTAVTATELTFAAGDTAKTVTVATVEDELNEAAETFTVALSGVTLPDGVSLNADKDEATGTITDDDALTVSVAGPGAKVEEGQTATFTVTVTGTSTSEVVVSYEVDTAASTATSGDDYMAPSETELTIGAGEASGTIEVVTNTDTVLEPDETLVLKLTAASTAGEVSVSTATATATVEDTGAVKVSVEDAAAIEGESVQFEVELSGAVSSEVVVSYATSDGTGAHPAAAGTDYTAVTATDADVQTAGDTAEADGDGGDGRGRR